MSVASTREYDVVIFVATEDELAVVLKQATWSLERDDGIVYVTCMRNKRNRIIRVALKRISAMGAETCILEVSAFLSVHPSQLVTMVGVCAGDRERNIKKGDIVIPGIVSSISNGKELSANGQTRRLLPSNRPHRHSPDVMAAIDAFHAEEWASLASEFTENATSCYKGVENESTQLTPRLHYGTQAVMAQVFHVRAYSGAFDAFTEEVDRKVMALDMESAALAYVAERWKTNWLVIKGVQDYADERKDDAWRSYCIQASTLTLMRFLSNNSLNLCRNKIETLDFPLTNRNLAAAIQVREAYRKGSYDAAVAIGELAFRNCPGDLDLWPVYLQALLRRSMYRECADVIDIADFYLQSMPMVKPRIYQTHEYDLHKAEFFWRIGQVADAEILLSKLLQAIGVVPDIHSIDLKEMNTTLAQAYYLMGMIRLDNYREQRNERDLNDAHNNLQLAAKIDAEIGGVKYWVYVRLILVAYLKKNVKGQEYWLPDAENRIRAAIADPSQCYRPAPRIYLLKLVAIKIASGLAEFRDMRKIIDNDKKQLKRKLSLPLDFFKEFEQDCKLLFSSNRNNQDQLLSMIYEWASSVRKIEQPET